jgi:hypothetical protein
VPLARWQSIRVTILSLCLLAGAPAMSGCGAKFSTTLHSDGQGGTVAMVPGSYNAQVASRWVIYFHGYGEGADVILTGAYGNTMQELVNHGYVVVAMNNTVLNCYGNAQCSKDVAGLIANYRSVLNLEPEPYAIATSMGGFTMLNAIAAGVMHPKAAVGWSMNTNLGWAYADGAGSAIAAVYDITESNSYELATAGYDPLRDAGNTFAAVPFELWSSYGDIVVPRAENTDPFAGLVNAAGGQVTVKTSTGGHLDESNFHAGAVVDFFNKH